MIPYTRSILKQNYDRKVAAPANAKAWEALTGSSAFFKLETPLHSEKEFDDDDVISSSSKTVLNLGESSLADVKSDVKLYSGWLRSFQFCINRDKY